MSILDKIKNALFEVEYVEVEEKPKKEKKMKSKDEKEDKPIAKKIVLPGKREEKVEEIQEEELKDEDFEIRPKDEAVKEVFRDNFNVMDDDDFVEIPVEAPKEEEVAPQPIVDATPIEPIFEEQPTTQPAQPVIQTMDTHYADKDYVREYDSYKEKVYSTIHDDYRVKTRESRPYGMDPSYQVSIKEYGSESKDEKSYFRPSPIISPIYGILDKNYRKEDVVTKREVHISSFVKANVNVDDVRNKAYGRKSEEIVPEEVVEEALTEKKKIEPAFTVEEEDENLLVDLSDEKKPEVKEITVGDAMEYYHDLGLEYNVDYVDASNKNPPKKKPDDLEEDIKDTMNIPALEEEPVIEKTEDVEPEVKEEVPKEVVEEPKEEVVPEEKTETKEVPVVEEKEEVVVEEEPPKEEEKVVEEEPKEEVQEEKTEATIDDDDNLFDLIDSMYREDDN